MTPGDLNGKTEKLAALLSQFHSILKIAWPKPGVPQMSGASIFIGTNLFKTLEDGVLKIGETMSALDDSQGCELRPIWAAFTKLFSAIQCVDRGSKSKNVDFALNLLYLGSGVIYHHVAALDQRAVTGSSGVEPLDELVRQCEWPAEGQSRRTLAHSVTAALMACAADLSPQKGSGL